MARDNFPASVIKLLRDRVAHRCSNPSCRVPTSAPLDESGVNNIGKAAHICAASSGGPRYDPSMTTEQRKSISNGIWLCANHADSIDRDISGHPVDLLHRWKRDAEATAKREHGSRLPKDGDAVEMLTQALTGHSQSFMAKSISNAHAASAGALEKLDPRFKVSSSYDQLHGARFSLSAQENVDVSLRVKPDFYACVEHQFSKFMDDGLEFEVDVKNIKLVGSPLLSYITEITSSDEGKLQIGTKPVRVVSKLALVDIASGRHQSLDDLQGDLIVGSKYMTFNGSSMGGLLSLNFTRPIETQDEVIGIKFRFNFELWRGQLITKLPWFSKIILILEAIENGWQFDVTLELNGDRLLAATVRPNQDEAAKVCAALRYTELAKELSTYLGLALMFNDETPISGEQFDILTKAVETSRGYSQGLKEFKPPARLEFGEMKGSGAELFKQQTTKLAYLSITKPAPWSLVIFGTEISTPDIIYTFNNCRIERATKVGMRQRFEIFPEPGFSIDYRYDIPNKQ